MRVVMTHEFADFTGLDREDVLFDDALWDYISSKRELSDWWADNQGRFV